MAFLDPPKSFFAIYSGKESPAGPHFRIRRTAQIRSV
jgi:hypothetical protein